MKLSHRLLLTASLLVVLLILLSAIAYQQRYPLLQFAATYALQQQCEEAQLSELSISNTQLSIPAARLDCFGWTIEFENLLYQFTELSREALLNGSLHVESISLEQHTSTADNEKKRAPVEHTISGYLTQLENLPRVDIQLDSFYLALAGDLPVNEFAGQVNLSSLDSSSPLLLSGQLNFPVELAVDIEYQAQQLKLDINTAGLALSQQYQAVDNKHQLQSDIKLHWEDLPPELRRLANHFIPSTYAVQQLTLDLSLAQQLDNILPRNSRETQIYLARSGQARIDLQSLIRYDRRYLLNTHFSELTATLADALELTWNKPVQLTVHPVKPETAVFSQLDASLPEGQLSFTPDSGELTLQLNTAETGIKGEYAADAQWNALTLTWLDKRLSYQTQLSLRHHSQLPFAGVGLSGQLSGDLSAEQQLNFQFSGSAIDLNLLSFSAKGHYQIQQQQAEIQLNIPDWGIDSQLVKQLAPELPLSIKGGRLSLKSELKLVDKDPRYQASIKTLDLRGDYDGLPFMGVNATVDIGGSAEAIKTLTPLDLSVEEFNTGVLIKNIDARLALNYNLEQSTADLDIEKARAELLGGRAEITPTRFNYPVSKRPLLIDFKSLDLGKIIQLGAIETLSGNGIVDATLPVTLDKSGINLTQGSIVNIEKGNIRYQPTAAEKRALSHSNPEMLVLLDILDNFHYDVLKSELSLKGSNELGLNVNFEGRNPDYKGGTQVNFNPSLELELKPLLQLLQLRNIGDEYAEKLRKKHAK